MIIFVERHSFGIYTLDIDTLSLYRLQRNGCFRVSFTKIDRQPRFDTNLIFCFIQ